jgi:hypothetical protein
MKKLLLLIATAIAFAGCNPRGSTDGGSYIMYGKLTHHNKYQFKLLAVEQTLHHR